MGAVCGNELGDFDWFLCNCRRIDSIVKSTPMGELHSVLSKSAVCEEGEPPDPDTVRYLDKSEFEVFCGGMGVSNDPEKRSVAKVVWGVRVI